MSLGHISIPTGPSKFKAMRDFYLATLEFIGYTIYAESEQWTASELAAGGVGPQYIGLQSGENRPDFWLHAGAKDIPQATYTTDQPHSEMAGQGIHIAWMVESDAKVDEWYQVALKHGGVANGEPGERAQYSKGYYAAFVLDPLGNNIEVAHKNPS